MKRLKSGGPPQGFDGMNPYLALGGSGNIHKPNEGQTWNGEGSFNGVKLEHWNEYGNYSKEGERHTHGGEATEEA